MLVSHTLEWEQKWSTYAISNRRHDSLSHKVIYSSFASCIQIYSFIHTLIKKLTNYLKTEKFIFHILFHYWWTLNHNTNWFYSNTIFSFFFYSYSKSIQPDTLTVIVSYLLIAQAHTYYNQCSKCVSYNFQCFSNAL